MAESYIALTRPEIIDESWPPKIDKPVNTEEVTYFPAAASNPVANSQEASIMSGHTPPDQPGRVVSNEPTKTTPSGAPVNNDHGPATIHQDASHAWTRPSTPAPTQSDVQLHPGGLPMRNDGAAIIHHGPERLGLPREPVQVPRPPSGTISNENNVSFVPSAPQPSSAFVPPPTEFGLMPIGRPSTPVDVPADPYAPMNVNGDVFLAPSHNGQGHPQTVHNEGTQFYATGQTMYADNDKTFGKSGESNKVAGRDDVTFGGAGGTMSIGGTDVTQTASGDTTKTAGMDDTIMTETRGMIGNHETQTGAKGDPTSNSQFLGVQNGAVGKPVQRNRS